MKWKGVTLHQSSKVSLETIFTARTHQISEKLYLSVLGKKFRIKRAQDLMQHLTMKSTI